jgi:hypothetical protein
MRIIAMNEPITIERALIGREIALDDPNDDMSTIALSASASSVQNHPPSTESKAVPTCRSFSNVDNGYQVSMS